LELLQKQRHALSQAMRVAMVVERLNRSLEAVLVTKNSGDYLPRQALKFFDELNPQAQSISTPMLKEYIDKLEQRVSVDFSLLLDITRIAGDPSAQGAALVGVDDIDSFVEEFLSHAKKLVGLRVLLHKRGEPSPGLKLEVPTQSLQKRAKQVADLEASYRYKIRHDVVQLQQETLALFDNATLEAGMRDILQQIYDDLQAALEHIDRGGSLEQIPVMVQTIQIDSTPLNGELFYAEIRKVGEDAHAPPEPQDVAADPAPPTPKRRGFWQTLLIWINTPLKVSWKDIREGR
jgi:hypothetical protein